MSWYIMYWSYSSSFTTKKKISSTEQRKRASHDGHVPCCPVCGLTLRAGELEAHLILEVEKLDKITRYLNILFFLYFLCVFGERFYFKMWIIEYGPSNMVPFGSQGASVSYIIQYTQLWYTHSYAVHTVILFIFRLYTQLYYRHIYTVHTIMLYTQLYCTSSYTVHTIILYSFILYTQLYYTHLYYIHNYTIHRFMLCTQLYYSHSYTIHTIILTHIYAMHIIIL